ncbi:MAG: DUF2334 domain-containing protein [Chthoniobacterales bacterium]
MKTEIPQIQSHTCCEFNEKSGSERALVVSLHDVSELTRERSDFMLKELAQMGVKKTSLLVIPDHHRRGTSMTSGAFVDWLKRQEEAGHEIVLHGYYHLRLTTRAGGFFKEMMASHYTAGEGEFYDISKSEARKLLQLGLAGFHEAGFFPKGFIAPAWLLGKESEEALREETTLAYTTLIDKVIDFQNAREFVSRSLVYSVRAAWRRQVSLLWNELLFRSLHENPLMRLGLHPPDWNYAWVKSHIRSIVRRALADRSAMTYENWRQAATPTQQ